MTLPEEAVLERLNEVSTARRLANMVSLSHYSARRCGLLKHDDY
jgi:hypothetical protein